MTIWRAIEGAATEPRTSLSAVTIGNFDGVHRGHQFVLDRTRQAAPEGSACVAVTFDPHPMEIILPERAPARLTTVERRVRLLREHGADDVRVLDFTREMASWSPEEFVQRVIVDQLLAGVVVVGENFRFGHKAAGDVALLRELGRANGFAVEGLELDREPGHDRDSTPAGSATEEPSSEPYSSTLVRRLVAEGRMVDAAAVLGRPHGVEGVVVTGDRRGREIGFPTANVPVDERFAVPPDGVYAGRLHCGDHSYPAAVSVGSNPTFGGNERRVESYVIDHGHDLDLYRRTVRVDLIQRLRGQVAFDDVDALIRQMDQDVAASRQLLG